MIFISILLSIAAIGFLCWLLFTLALFALPFFAGVTVGMWKEDLPTGLILRRELYEDPNYSHWWLDQVLPP